MKELKNIKIEKETYEKVKKYCNKNGLKIYYWVTQILLNEINKEKNNDNI